MPWPLDNSTPPPGITENPIAQLLGQTTALGQVPMQQMLLPLLLKQMGVPDVTTFSPEFARIAEHNKAGYAYSHMMAVDPQLANANRTNYESMITNLYASGATDANSLKIAREKANKTIEAAQIADRVGGMLGMDLGGGRFLDTLTGGVGNMEQAAADIVSGTADRRRYGSISEISDISKQVVQKLKSDVYEDDPLNEGQKRLRGDFRSRLGGMNLSEYGKTYATLSREGVLSRDTDLSIEQTKAMGGVISAGKAVFGQDAEVDTIISAAREYAGTIKPGDAEQIKQSFVSLAAVLDNTRMGYQEFFGKVQDIQNMARGRGVNITSREAGDIVTTQAYRTEALVNQGVDRTVAYTQATREAATRAQILGSGGEQRMLAAMAATNGDAAMAQALINGEAVDENVRRNFSLSLRNLQGPGGAEYANIIKQEYAKDPVLAQKMREMEAKGVLRDAPARMAALLPAINLNNDIRTKEGQAEFTKLYDQLSKTGGERGKIAQLARELGKDAGSLQTAYGTMFIGNTATGVAARAVYQSALLGSEDESIRRGANEMQARGERSARRKVVEQTKQAAALHDLSGDPNKMLDFLANKGNVAGEKDLIPDKEGLSDEANAERRKKIKTLIMMQAVSDDELRDKGITDPQAFREEANAKLMEHGVVGAESLVAAAKKRAMFNDPATKAAKDALLNGENMTATGLDALGASAQDKALEAARRTKDNAEATYGKEHDEAKKALAEFIAAVKAAGGKVDEFGNVLDKNGNKVGQEETGKPKSEADMKKDAIQSKYDAELAVHVEQFKKDGDATKLNEAAKKIADRKKADLDKVKEEEVGKKPTDDPAKAAEIAAAKAKTDEVKKKRNEEFAARRAAEEAMWSKDGVDPSKTADARARAEERTGRRMEVVEAKPSEAKPSETKAKPKDRNERELERIKAEEKARDVVRAERDEKIKELEGTNKPSPLPGETNALRDPPSGIKPTPAGGGQSSAAASAQTQQSVSVLLKLQENAGNLFAAIVEQVNSGKTP